MSQIVNTLPDFPNSNDLHYGNYFLFYESYTDSYRFVSFDYLISDTCDSSGSVRCHQGVVYYFRPSYDDWIFNNRFALGQSFVVDSFLIASTVDVYSSDGSLLCSAVSKDYFTNTISLVSDSITASTFLTALNETKTLFPILIVALVVVIAFRKSWRFLRGCIRGA